MLVYISNGIKPMITIEADMHPQRKINKHIKESSQENQYTRRKS